MENDIFVRPTNEHAGLAGHDDLAKAEPLKLRLLGADTLPALPLVRATNVGPSAPKNSAKPTKRSSRTPTTPTTNNNRSSTPMSTALPSLIPSNRLALTTPTTSSRPSSRGRIFIPMTTHYNSTFTCKLTSVQTALLLKPFWAALLANQLKPVRRCLSENHLKKLDFNAAHIRYKPNADATPLHLCAQYGLLNMAKLLVLEFGLAPTLLNKVGSTPLHVACKLARAEIVQWLIEEVHVPLDVPDAQLRIALDVASFDVVETCVLAPLYQQQQKLSQQVADLVVEKRVAEDRLENAALVLRQHSMLLCETESQLDQERGRMLEVVEKERDWQEQWQTQDALLEELGRQIDQQQQALAEEEVHAQALQDHEVVTVRDEHTQAQQELEELETLVATTQLELNRRRQLLMDQLGLFDASLREFGGSREVQQWVMATLLAIAYEESGEICRTELLLRAEPIEVVRHVLTTFPTDYDLQCSALELLVAVLRLHVLSKAKSWELFVAAVVDSDILVQLGVVLARWGSNVEKTATDKITATIFESLYLCLGLRKNAQRTLAFCQHKAVQLKALQVLGTVSASMGENCSENSSNRRWLMCYAVLVLLTQVKYGVKVVLLKAGVVRIAFETLQGISAHSISRVEDPSTSVVEIEIAQNLFATLALLLSSYSVSGIASSRKCREPVRLEDLAADIECINAGVVIDCVRFCVLPHSTHPSTIAATLWAFKLFFNITQHGGETALRLRQDLLHEAVEESGHDPFLILLQAVDGAFNVPASESSTQAVVAALNLFRVVWIERFDQEGRIVPCRTRVIQSLPEITASLIDRLLNHSPGSRTGVLEDLAASLHTLARAAQNSHNAIVLASHSTSTETAVLNPILQWTLSLVDETGTSYRERTLVTLLVRVLELFLRLTQARCVGHATFLQTATANEVAGFHRELHTQTHGIGVCAILKIFREMNAGDTTQSTSSEWTTLLALCSQIEELMTCPC